MALNAKTSAARRNAALDTAFNVLNSGLLRIYDGTQPTDADTALGAQVRLAQLTFGATAFAAAALGSKTANAITQDTSAAATGNATWGSLVQSGGVRATDTCMDFSVGTSGSNLNMTGGTSISSGNTVSCSSLVVTQAP